MQLLVLHPEVAWRDCGHCRLFVYDEESGLPLRQRNGEKDAEGLRPCVKRSGNSKPPCESMGQSCAKGKWDAQRSLSPKNRRAYWHYQQCKATGKWPEDGIVMRTAGIIEAALQQAEITRQWLQKKHQERLETLLMSALKVRASI